MPVCPLPTDAHTDGAYCTATADRQHIRNRVRRNDYGFTFGGPIRIPKVYDGRNKTFFFFNFEQFRQSNFTSNGTGHGSDARLTATATSARPCVTPTWVARLDGTGGTCTPFNAITLNGAAGSGPGGNKPGAGPDLRSLQHPARQRPERSHALSQQHDSR